MPLTGPAALLNTVQVRGVPKKKEQPTLCVNYSFFGPSVHNGKLDNPNKIKVSGHQANEYYITRVYEQKAPSESWMVPFAHSSFCFSMKFNESLNLAQEKYFVRNTLNATFFTLLI